MTTFSDMSDRADAAVNRWLVKTYRSEGDNEHLRACPALTIGEVDARDSTYGCDTGCEYARLEAVASCEHGVRDDFGYGQFGDLASMLEEILTDEGELEPPRLERPATTVTGWPVIPSGTWTRLLGANYEVFQNSGAAVPLRWTVVRVAGEYESLQLIVGDGDPTTFAETYLDPGGMQRSTVGALAFRTADGVAAMLTYRSSPEQNVVPHP